MSSLELHPISDHPSLTTEGSATESEADAEHVMPGRKTVVESEEGGLLRAASSLCMRLVSFRRTFSLFYEANPYVVQGYRKPSRRLSIALKSAFRIHNETVNIWSHIIPTIIWATALIRDTWHLGDAPWLVTWSLISGVICFSMSALYHLFRFMSPNAFKSWLKMDHLGVCLLILSCELTWTQLLFTCLPVAKTVYTFCILSGGAIVITATLLPQRPRAVLASLLGVREYEVAEPIMAVIAFSGFVGLFHYLFYYGASLAAQHIFVEASLYISGFVIFSLKLPERIVPMVFDIWGNSHQLWHIIIVISSIWHVYGLQWFGHLYHMNCLTDEYTNPPLL